MQGYVNIRPISNGFIVQASDGASFSEVYCEDFSDVLAFLEEVEDEITQFVDNQRNELN